MKLGETKRIKVLYAEDELVTAKYIMKKIGISFDIFHALNGVDAWKIFQEEGDFDVCLLDLIMPKMDGIELIKLIRSTNLEVPIIIISGAGDKIREDAKSAGANAILKKPHDIDFLMKILSVLPG